MGHKLGNRSLKRLVGVHPMLAFCVHEAIKISEVDFGVLDGVRTMKRQRTLVRQGKSKTFKSYHLYGLAVDLVPFINGRYTWEDEEAFILISEAMNEVINRYDLKIQWGFKKWGWDMPHWQMTGYRSKYDIRRIDSKRFPS
jgi:peptidoglycan L-alanyl-D-glutamate endopeptidase CwlK